MILMSATLCLSTFAAKINGQSGNQPSSSTNAASASERFTGSLTVRQKGGSLYYKIFVVRGSVIGGYDTWRGSSTHYHRIVGGWYDGERMMLLVQSTQDDFGDKWYSHAHQFEKEGDEFVITHSLYGFGKTIGSGEVYTPHAIDEISELPAEQVERLAATAEREPSPTATRGSEDRKLRKRSKQLERENTRLKELVGELVLEKRKLQRELREK